MEELRYDISLPQGPRTDLPFSQDTPPGAAIDLPIRAPPQGNPLDLPYTTVPRHVKVTLDYRRLFDAEGQDPVQDLLDAGSALRAAHRISVTTGFAKDGFGSILAYQIRLEGPDSGVKSAAASAFVILGLPEFVRGDTSLLEDMLSERGKELQRKLEGFFVGRHVVDRRTEWAIRPYCS